MTNVLKKVWSPLNGVKRMIAIGAIHRSRRLRRTLTMPARRVSRAAVALGCVLAMTMVSVALAYTRVYEGSDYAGVEGDLRAAEACDRERDGNGVYGEYQLAGGGTMKIPDGNGSPWPCGKYRAWKDVTRFRVCEDNWGSDDCSVWQRAYRG